MNLTMMHALLAAAMFSNGSLSMAQETNSARETLTNKSVIGMVAARLPDDLVIAKIESSRTHFDLSTNGLIELNRAKVSTAVIKFMMARSGAASAGNPIAPTNAGRRTPPRASEIGVPNTPGEVEPPAEPGIYLFADSGETKAFQMLEPTVYTQGKSGGFLKSALTYGIAKQHTKAVIRGETANLRTSDRQPVFYFVFEQTHANLSNANSSLFGNGVSSPNEFTLIHLSVKNGSRETVVLSENIFGSQSGTADNDIVPYTFTKLRPGVYKVIMKDRLEPGEYSFLSAAAFNVPTAGMVGAAAANRLWDFSVRR